MNPRIHPLSLKSIKSGHPWITADSFSKKFPKEFLLEIEDPDTDQFLGTFLHDYKHPKVKARFWSPKPEFNFEKTLIHRLNEALKRRKGLKRDNQYLVFGESDSLPGLFIQYLDGNILIQYQAYFWRDYLELITKFFESALEYESLWEQMRIPGEQKKSPNFIKGERNNRFVVNENGIKFIVKMDKLHDIGLYTDMAAIREEISDWFKPNMRVLNLFSYTGAFSLMALKTGSEVASVDISKKYMSWLEENIEENGFDKTRHQSIVKSCEKYIQNTKEKFDLIIIDPPSFSSDGKKRQSAIDFYKKNQDALFSLLNKGGKMICFLNTHSISKGKFRRVFTKKTLTKELRLKEDCQVMSSFPEGSYIKGLVFEV